MCGRFVNLTKTSSLKKIFNSESTLAKNLISYNISPTQNSCIIFKNNIHHIEEARWGYSFTDKKNNQLKNVINSRLETIKNKVIFKESYLKRKCLIPTNGYYEWSIINGNKIPFFIHIPPSELFYLAGIWKYIDLNKDEKKIFTIITKNANINISKIHHRMPLILSQTEGEKYLNDYNFSFVDISFSSKIETDLDFYSISKFINNPLNNSKKCIEPAN